VTVVIAHATAAVAGLLLLAGSFLQLGRDLVA
jgi:hypothetical protein